MSKSEKYKSNRMLWECCMHGSYLKENDTYNRTCDVVPLLDKARLEGINNVLNVLKQMTADGTFMFHISDLEIEYIKSKIDEYEQK